MNGGHTPKIVNPMEPDRDTDTDGPFTGRPGVPDTTNKFRYWDPRTGFLHA